MITRAGILRQAQEHGSRELAGNQQHIVQCQVFIAFKLKEQRRKHLRETLEGMGFSFD